MSRVIKFRGHTVPFEEEDYKYEGEWVYGYFHLGMGNTHHIIEPRFKEELVVGIAYPGKEVIPESVGEFAGLLDKKGNEIYEGDIVEAKTLIGDEVIRGKVIFDNRGMWMAEEIHPVYAEREYLYELTKSPARCEIIGNIYEHPSLLQSTK